VIKAKFESYLTCGHHASIGDPIGKADDGWVCRPCYLRYRNPPSPRPASSREHEQLLADPKIKALLCKALATDNEHEAAACLNKARQIHMTGKKAAAA
jgi:hypothetical protein